MRGGGGLLSWARLPTSSPALLGCTFSSIDIRRRGRRGGASVSYTSVSLQRFINPDFMNQNADPGPPNRDARDAPNENCGPFWFGASKYLCVL